MSQSQTGVKLVDWQTVSQTNYDAVIVGGGIAGAITAKQLSEQGKRVLVRLFVTCYGSIGGHKSTKSLSGKRLN
ncbi:hypothetical protein MICAB_5940016 [Microcystis aeruginosa PCC 9717]|uniref:FAD dependent oxidoreductase domain-containing protein n=1 Tax=Microcystis aeruginosa PCC 9717 TaxID=1160286 RepID=I4FUA8_MICAE|nr:NAD(P)-binding protein [Microcystis aeruginosa]CCH99233.1 hypothetical protein MICAB_5940016 [Microcystis aeruginosa PCC 9717]